MLYCNLLLLEMYGIDDIKNAKGMHIAHLNVRSIMNKWDTFKAQFGESNIHVLGISESWLSDKIPSSLLNLSHEHVLLRNDRKWTDDNTGSVKKGGGLGIFINSKLNYSESDFGKLNCSNRNIESQWVSIKQPHRKQIVIGNIYRPPQGNIESFIDYLDIVFTEINLDRIELFLMGDFNIDFMEKTNANCKKLMDLIKPLGLRQIIKNPTRLSANKLSCLDLLITNSNSIENVGIVDINLSDHAMILCSKKQKKITKTKCNFVGRSYKNYNIDIFQQNIKDTNWDEFDESPSVTTKWEILEKMIRSNIDAMCPLKTYKIKQEKEPWITNNLIELIKDKDKALRQAKRSKDPQL